VGHAQSERAAGLPACVQHCAGLRLGEPPLASGSILRPPPAFPTETTRTGAALVRLNKKNQYDATIENLCTCQCAATAMLGYDKFGAAIMIAQP